MIRSGIDEAGVLIMRQNVVSYDEESEERRASKRPPRHSK